MIRYELTLALLVTWVVADDHDATVAANDFALIANLLNAWVNLHDLAPVFNELLVTVNNATSGEVIWT